MGLKLLFIFLATLLALLPGMVVFSIEMNTETFNGNTFCWVFFKIYFGKKKKAARWNEYSKQMFLVDGC